MNDPLETLLELRAYLAERAEYYNEKNGRLVPNTAQELLIKLDELIDASQADRELEQREAILEERIRELRKEARAKDFMEDKE